MINRIPCEHCAERKGRAFAHQITMAFQPIFDVEAGTVFAQEALLRGKDGQSAGQMLALVDEQNMYSFDQTCRTTAIEVASRLGLTDRLSINFMPNAVYEPRHCIQRTLWAADAYNFAIENIIFEFTEVERIRDKAHLLNIVSAYKEMGFQTALDDFGAGWSGLSLLADIVPDIIKIDRELITGIDACGTRQKIVRQLSRLCDDLGVAVVAEGIETEQEFDALREMGIRLLQGYYLARPQLEALQTAPLLRQAA